jgi:acetyltransferase-like isoleucine patch superfamily enzyme
MTGPLENFSAACALLCQQKVIVMKKKVKSAGRVFWAVLSGFIVESIIFGFSVLPAAIFWEWHFQWTLPWNWLRTILLSMAFIPAYFLFAISLMILSAFAMRLLGWRSPVDAEMTIKNLEWPLLNWGRYMASIHLVRIFAGIAFRSTPLWTFYMRMNGARLGPRVFVNSLLVSDHNLLDFGKDVVIGSEAHLSGHTVEQGKVKTGRVHLEDGVTVGASAIVGIGVEAGRNCTIGALSLVPKFTKLEEGRIYAGVPVRVVPSNLKAEKPA